MQVCAYSCMDITHIASDQCTEEKCVDMLTSDFETLFRHIYVPCTTIKSVKKADIFSWSLHVRRLPGS